MSDRVVEPITGVYRLSTRLGVDRLGALPMEAFRTLRPTAFIVNRQTFVSALHLLHQALLFRFSFFGQEPFASTALRPLSLLNSIPSLCI